MKHNLQRSLIWMVSLLAAVPFASAAEGQIGAILRPFADLFGSNPGAVFLQYDQLIVSILGFAIIFSIVYGKLHPKLGKFAGGTAGATLGIAFTVYVDQSGFSIVELTPIMAIMVFVLVAGLVFYGLRLLGIKNNILLLVLSITAAGTMLRSTVLFLNEGPMGPWFRIVWSISSVLVVILIIWYIIDWARGKGHGDRAAPYRNAVNDFGEGVNRRNAVRNTLSNDEDKAARLGADVNSQQAKEAQQVLDAELERMRRDAAADVQQDQAMAAADGTAEQGVASTEQFLEGAEKGLREAKDAPAAERDAYIQQLEEKKQALNQYFDQIENTIVQEENAFIAPDALEADEKMLEQHRANIEKYTIGEIKEERKLMEDISATEQVVAGAYNRVQELAGKTAGVQLPPNARNVVQATVASMGQYQQHLDKVKQLKNVFQQAEALAEQSSKLQDKLKKDVERVEKMRKEGQEKAHQTRKKFKEYKQNATTAIDLRSDDVFKQAEDEHNVVVQGLNEMTDISRELERAHMAIATDTQELEQIQQKFRPLQQQFVQEAPKLIGEEKLLDAKATAGELVYDVAIASQDLSTEKLTGLDKLGLKAFSRQNKGRNVKSITQHIDKQMGSALNNLSKAEKKEQNTPAGEVMTAAYVAASDIRNELVDSWTRHISQKTEETEKMIQEAAKAGPRGSFKNLPGGSGSK